MYEIERQDDILKYLKENKTISVSKLAQLLYVSEATIRRDLNKLESKGFVTRTFGGVIINPQSPNKEINFELRETANQSVKRLLCQKAASLIKDNQTIFIDSSTTLLNIVNYLNNFKNLVIITNGLFIANEIISLTHHQVILPGGFVQANTNSMLGTITIKNLQSFHCDISIMSSSAIDLEFGLSESTIEQSQIKQVMIFNSDVKISLCDETKFRKKSLYKTCSISELDYFLTNAKLTLEEQNYLDNCGVKYKI